MTSIGTSGWSYDHWEPVLYPPGLAPGARLDRYAERSPPWSSTAASIAGRGRGLRHLAATAAGRIPDVGQGPARAHPRRKLLNPSPGSVASRPACTSWATARRAAGPARARPAADDARLDWFLGAVPGWSGWRSSSATRAGIARRCSRCSPGHGAAYCVISGASFRASCGRPRPSSTSGCTARTTDHLYAGSYREDDLRWWADRIREWAGQGPDVLGLLQQRRGRQRRSQRQDAPGQARPGYSLGPSSASR